MGFCLRDSLTFRTIFLLALPILLKKVGGTRVVQSFVRMGCCLKCPVEVSGLVLIRVDSSTGSVCSPSGLLSLTLEANPKDDSTFPLSS